MDHDTLNQGILYPIAHIASSAQDYRSDQDVEKIVSFAKMANKHELNASQINAVRSCAKYASRGAASQLNKLIPARLTIVFPVRRTSSLAHR
jgi:tRNA A37 threonylcarbamoyladenosine synthetase subunit TsaC/SUA5/YrdC